MALALSLALTIHGLLIWAGYFSPKETLLELLQQGETETIPPTITTSPPPPVEVELVPPPPEEAHPEFIQPIEVAVQVTPPVEEDLEDELPPEPPPEPPVTTTPPPDQPTPKLVETEPPPAAASITPPPVTIPDQPTPDPVAQTTPSPELFAPENFSAGDKDFPRPPYPYEAKLKKFEGTVLLSVTVENGKITNLDIANSSGYTLLDRSAVSWIRKKWHFPEETSQTYTVPVAYQLLRS